MFDFFKKIPLLVFTTVCILSTAASCSKNPDKGVLSSSSAITNSSSSISAVSSSSNSSNSSSISPKIELPQVIQTAFQTYPAIQPEPAAQQVAEIIQDDKESGLLLDVQKVIDGDTVKVSQIGKLRLIGIDTPEDLEKARKLL